MYINSTSGYDEDDEEEKKEEEVDNDGNVEYNDGY